jgi:hypothetical protein
MALGGTADRRPAVDPTALQKKSYCNIPPFYHSTIPFPKLLPCLFPSLSWRLFLGQKVQDRKKRVAPDHPGTGIAHHVNDPRTHVRLVTVDCTFQAGRFLSLEGTVRQAFARIRL